MRAIDIPYATKCCILRCKNTLCDACYYDKALHSCVQSSLFDETTLLSLRNEANEKARAHKPETRLSSSTIKNDDDDESYETYVDGEEENDDDNEEEDGSLDDDDDDDKEEILIPEEQRARDA